MRLNLPLLLILFIISACSQQELVFNDNTKNTPKKQDKPNISVYLDISQSMRGFFIKDKTNGTAIELIGHIDRAFSSNSKYFKFDDKCEVIAEAHNSFSNKVLDSKLFFGKSNLYSEAFKSFDKNRKEGEITIIATDGVPSPSVYKGIALEMADIEAALAGYKSDKNFIAVYQYRLEYDGMYPRQPDGTRADFKLPPKDTTSLHKGKRNFFLFVMGDIEQAHFLKDAFIHERNVERYQYFGNNAYKSLLALPESLCALLVTNDKVSFELAVETSAVDEKTLTNVKDEALEVLNDKGEVIKSVSTKIDKIDKNKYNFTLDFSKTKPKVGKGKYKLKFKKPLNVNENWAGICYPDSVNNEALVNHELTFQLKPLLKAFRDAYREFPVGDIPFEIKTNNANPLTGLYTLFFLIGQPGDNVWNSIYYVLICLPFIFGIGFSFIFYNMGGNLNYTQKKPRWVLIAIINVVIAVVLSMLITYMFPANCGMKSMIHTIMAIVLNGIFAGLIYFGTSALIKNNYRGLEDVPF